MVLLFSLCSYMTATANSEKIVNGFSAFLIERGNANLLAVFERRLKSDDNFQCYFPNTYEKINKIKLNNLFASKGYWEHSLGTDIEILIYRSILLEAQRGLKLIDRNLLIKYMQYFEYEYQGIRYPLTHIGLGWSQSLIDQVNGFSYGMADALNRINDQKIFENVCDVKAKNKDELKKLIQHYLDAGDSLVDWVKHTTDYGENLRLTTKGKEVLFYKDRKITAKDCEAVKYDELSLLAKFLNTNDFEKLKKAALISKNIRKVYASLDAIDNEQSDVIDKIVLFLPLLRNDKFKEAEIKSVQLLLQQAKALSKEKQQIALVAIMAKIKQKVTTDDIDAIRILSMLDMLINEKQNYTDRALVALDLLESSDLFNSSSSDRLRRFVMFFATIADAEDKDAVKSILNSYTLPAVCFAEKRMLGFGFFISSYLGIVAAGSETHGSNEEGPNGGLFVPVGIEFNYGASRGDSWSLMLAPIDMAYPINLKLNGIDDQVDFEEIFAPSVTLSYGLKDYPLNVGIGYQRGRTLEDVEKAEERLLLFVSFDMPLYRLY